jgi:hypothetical protein
MLLDAMGGWTLAVSSGLSLSAFLGLLILRTKPARAAMRY